MIQNTYFACNFGYLKVVIMTQNLLSFYDGFLTNICGLAPLAENVNVSLIIMMYILKSHWTIDLHKKNANQKTNLHL